MWIFNIQSFFREYGWQFMLRVALPHPIRTLRAVLASNTLDFAGDKIAVPNETEACRFPDARPLVGVGFCLKPLDPPCPSGRFNHDCQFLENRPGSDIPACCQTCAIREMGLLTLNSGAAFYIMTSAKDILFDLYVPALRDGRFSSALLVLCRYSLQPFAVGLMATGIRGCMFPFKDGDCADYKTWLEADRGVKKDQTRITGQTQSAIRDILEKAALSSKPGTRFIKRGNILHPES